MSTSPHPVTSPPSVSVGMPAYNSSKWIGAAIESILDQSFGDFELIISDNASTDSTYAICEGYARQDSRIRLVRNPLNVGANRNYLAVLAQARGSYFKWASSNDICAPAFLQRCVEALEADRSAVLAFPMTTLFEMDTSDGEAYDSDFELLSDEASQRLTTLLDSIRLNNAFNGVIRRAALLAAAPMGNFQRADIALMAELVLLGKFLLVRERLFFRRMSEDSATRLKTPKQVDLHLAPQAVRPLQWQNWLYHFALLRAAWRQGPLTAKSLAALRHVLRQMRWSRAGLISDVNEALSRRTW